AATVAAAQDMTIRGTRSADRAVTRSAWNARCMRIALLFAALLMVAGCGSEPVRDLPPAAEPPSSPPVSVPPAGHVISIGHGAVGVVSVRKRKLEIYNARTFEREDTAPAGVGPTHIACLPNGPCLVTDTQGQSLLRFVLHPHLELVRSQHLPGGPYGIALDAA